MASPGKMEGVDGACLDSENPIGRAQNIHSGRGGSLDGLSVGTLYNLMSNDRLRTLKIGGRRLVACEALDALLRVSDESKGSNFNKVVPS
jgi:hypothetical protein